MGIFLPTGNDLKNFLASFFSLNTHDSLRINANLDLASPMKDFRLGCTEKSDTIYLFFLLI